MKQRFPRFFYVDFFEHELSRTGNLREFEKQKNTMKKLFVLLLTCMALAAINPIMGQTRKDKKEAKKEDWKTEQQYKREEAELLHKMRMDSIANAQKVANEKAAKAEAERRQQEAEAKAKQKKAEEEAAAQEKDFDEPCSDYMSSANVIYGRGTGEDFEQQMSVDMARTSAIEELGSQLSTKVQALVSNYRKQERKNTSRESVRRIEGLTMTEVDQSTGFRIACRKTTTYIDKGEKLFKTYMVIELNEDVILSSIYKKIQKDEDLKVNSDYQSFKKEFDDHFKNKSEDMLQEIINE